MQISESEKMQKLVWRRDEMDLLHAYKKNPCGVLSIPYWKNKCTVTPKNIRILHNSDFLCGDYKDYCDALYFRLYHSLERIDNTTLDGISIVSAVQEDIPVFTDIINQSYTDITVTNEQLWGYTKTEVYRADLWILAVDNITSMPVGCGIADFDRELREGIIEWIQVIPMYRRKKIGSLIVNELLRRISNIADFATVSGKVNHTNSPEMLYRKCGFTGNDIWHILTKTE